MMPPAPEMGMEEPPMDDMGMDPNAMGNENTDMGEQPSPEMGTEGGEDDSTMSIINQLSDEDKKSVRAYAESMLDRNNNGDEEVSDGTQNGEMGMDDENAAPPIPESKTFTKKQLKEEFGVKVSDSDDTSKNGTKPRKKIIRQNSPFNPPMFK